MMESAETLESLRTHFAMLSEAMIEATQSFGLEKEKVYKHFCPMAFNDNGAFWLSKIEEIRNSYFGKAMLNCGEIHETHLKGQKVFEKGEPVPSSSVGGHSH